MRAKHILLLLVIFACFNCGGNELKVAEKQILSEINQITEVSRARMHSPEIRASMNRMHELSRMFPQHREELERETKSVVSLYSSLIDDNDRTNVKWKELLELPLSETYKKCVEAQVQSMSASTLRLQLTAEEASLYLDPTIKDKKALETASIPIRNRKIEAESMERQADAEGAANCKRTT